MLHTTITAVGGHHLSLFTRHITFAQLETAQNAVHLSGSRFFFTVLAGLVLAFAFQMLLTNFSVALGISVLSPSMGSSSDEDSGSSVPTVSIAVGVWTLISVSLALFGACALALRFSVLATPLQAITLALIIWAAYFTALVWISSTTVGSLIGSVVNTATSSFQTIFGAASAAIGAKAAKSELVATAEETVAAIRRQVTADIDPEDLQDSLKDYLSSLRSPELDLNNLRHEFEQVLQDSDTTQSIEPEHLDQINRSTFEQLVNDRTDISPREQALIVDKMEKAWNQASRSYQKRDRFSELLEFMKTAAPNNLLSDDLSVQLKKFIQERRAQEGGNSFLNQGLNTLMGIALGRIDLSDLEVEKISSQIKQVKQHVTEQVDQAYLTLNPETQPPTIIGTDVENYILNTQPWRLTREHIPTEFRQVLVDPEANLAIVKKQIAGLSSMDFAALLRSRGIFTQAKINQITALLRQTCQDVLDQVTTALERQKKDALSKKTFTYLSTTPQEQLTTEQIHNAYGALIADDDADADQLRSRFSVLTRADLLQPLGVRNDISPEEKNRILNDMQWAMEKAIADAEGVKASVEKRVQHQWTQVQDYLRSTGKPELSPEGMRRDLETLLDHPEAGIHDLQARLARFDRETLVQLLSQRDDITESDVNQIITEVESNWSKVKHAPDMLSAKAQAKYQQATDAIANYLRRTGKSELSPNGIRRDIKLLLNDPQAGYEAIYSRLASMDRDTLVQLLSQRKDLSEAEINQTIDQVEQAVQQVVKAPKRLARRTQEQLQNFQASLEDYLKSTHKEELNPEGIKRDVEALINDPRWGMQRLGDRLSHMDDSTLVALLAQRDDLTTAEAQDIVNQIVSVRDQVKARITAITDQVKLAINSILERIRLYLNSLDRPELNYEAVRSDVRTLLDDPQAGFEALRDRLARFDRDTLVAVVSSHDNISKRDVNQVIDQIESTRTQILQRAERTQRRFEERLERLKQQAADQVEATRKTAAIAAWWLFATAVISGAAASFGAIVSL